MQKKVRGLVMVAACLTMAACGHSFSAHHVSPRQETSPRGPEIVVRTLGRISANTVSAGERIEVELAGPVTLEGLPRLAESVKAVLHVVDVNHQGKRGRGRPLLRLRLTQLRPSKTRYVEIHSQVREFVDSGAHLAEGTLLAFELEATPRGAELLGRRAQLE